MADRPILFSAPMVRALLAGRKTQTRRLAASPLRRVEVGDRLYVREACAIEKAGYFVPRNVQGRIHYRADGVPRPPEPTATGLRTGRWRPSIHMPRCASRLTLIVEGVKVEPLQAISLADLRAEGLHQKNGSQLWWATDDVAAFEPDACFGTLWNALHAKPGELWEDNPHVVALTFRVEQRNIDQVGA